MNSLSFKGLRKPYLMVTHRKRSYWAPRSLVLIQKQKGARLKRIEKDVRIEEARVEITSEGDLRKVAEDLAGWLISDKEEELVFDDEYDRSYLAVVDGSFDAEEIVTVGYGTIKFVCPGSDKLGPEQSINLATTYQTFTITGQTETPWTSKTTFAVPASQFILETDQGGKIILNYDFIKGDVLEIDYENRDVFLNGKDLAVSVALETVWFELEPGEIQLKASHETVVTYTGRYY